MQLVVSDSMASLNTSFCPKLIRRTTVWLSLPLLAVEATSIQPYSEPAAEAPSTRQRPVIPLPKSTVVVVGFLLTWAI